MPKYKFRISRRRFKFCLKVKVTKYIYLHELTRITVSFSGRNNNIHLKRPKLWRVLSVIDSPSRKSDGARGFALKRFKESPFSAPFRASFVFLFVFFKFFFSESDLRSMRFQIKTHEYVWGLTITKGDVKIIPISDNIFILLSQSKAEKRKKMYAILLFALNLRRVWVIVHSRSSVRYLKIR